MKLEQIEPREVFMYFEQICAIPHGSRNVKQISDYCVQFAKEQHLKYRQDEKYNVVIWKTATNGYEQCAPVILQGHMDMVCVKEEGCTKNLETQGLDLQIRDGLLEANQTSLGGDDGIAIAYSLALLASRQIEHPALTAIFTVDEEVGMDGAEFLDMSDIEGNILLNMDSEEEGIFLAGCAGGATVRASFPVKREKKEGFLAQIGITGLTGGHSGTDIVFQRANANVLLGRVMNELSKKLTFGLVHINGGEKDNVIAKSSKLSVLIEQKDAKTLLEVIQDCSSSIRHEYCVTDPELAITVEIAAGCAEFDCIADDSAMKIRMALLTMPYGIQKMSNEIKGLVQTSLNLGILAEEQKQVFLEYSVRSSLGSEKNFIIDKIAGLTQLLGGSCQLSGKYPAWEYRSDSPLRDLMISVYQKMYGKDPEIQTIHAGLECGILAGKIDDLDCVSFGPDIFDIHTTRERLSIDSVKRTWELTLEVLKEMKNIRK